MSLLRRIWSVPGGRLGLVLSVLMITVAIAAPLLAPYPPTRIDVLARLTGPSAAHWLGTDQLGRDLLSRLFYGARIAVGVGLVVVLLALAAGTLLGVTAAYAPRPVDRLIMACFDIISSFPSLILALALVAVLGPGLTNVIALVTVVFIPHYGRVARAQTLILKSRPFLEAETVMGAGIFRIVRHHVLPNIAGPIIVLASMDIPVVITLEAGLSFLGVGVRPPLASWGSMLFDGFTYLNQSAWPVIAAGVTLTLATLGFTLLGESLRDAIDPKLRRRA